MHLHICMHTCSCIQARMHAFMPARMRAHIHMCETYGTQLHEHKHTLARHSESRVEKRGLEGRFKWCYRRRVSERVGKDCSRVMALDIRGRIDQKTWDEWLEDEGVHNYQQMNEMCKCFCLKGPFVGSVNIYEAEVFWVSNYRFSVHNHSGSCFTSE